MGDSASRRKYQPPVSLAPLNPEEALAGLMQVKPGRETQMPKFTNGDKVMISADAKITVPEALGKVGTVVWLPMEGRRTTRLQEGARMTAKRTDVWYDVRLHLTRAVVNVEESDLTPA